MDGGNDLPTAPLEGVVRLFDAVAIGCVRLDPKKRLYKSLVGRAHGS